MAAGPDFGSDAVVWVWESACAIAALAVSLWLRPWRMLRGPLLTPALALVTLLPLLWLLPQHVPAGLSMQFSGASLAVLVLGWPLAMPALAVVAGLVWALGQADAAAVLSQWVWLGIVPATLALGLGAVLRRWLPPNPFIYTLGRGFIGTALVVFVATALFEWLHPRGTGLPWQEVLVARWLMAWGDAFLTGLVAAVFVAFAPQWLATWSDDRYLQKPPAP